MSLRWQVSWEEVGGESKTSWRTCLPSNSGQTQYALLETEINKPVNPISGKGISADRPLADRLNRKLDPNKESKIQRHCTPVTDLNPTTKRHQHKQQWFMYTLHWWAYLHIRIATGQQWRRNQRQVWSSEGQQTWPNLDHYRDDPEEAPAICWCITRDSWEVKHPNTQQKVGSSYKMKARCYSHNVQANLLMLQIQLFKRNLYQLILYGSAWLASSRQCLVAWVNYKVF